MFYTDRQLAIMEFLQRYRRMAGKSPTLGEIAEHFHVSKVTVHDHVRQLEAKGAVRKAPHLARSLEIVDPDFLEPDPSEETGDERLVKAVIDGTVAGTPLRPDANDGRDAVAVAEATQQSLESRQPVDVPLPAGCSLQSD